MGSVDPSSKVGPEAELAAGVEVGPNCVVEGRVRIGEGSKVGPSCLLRGPAEIGKGNEFHGHCVVDASQDKKRGGAGGSIEIGDGNVVREFATLHRATEEGKATRIGDGNLLMAYSHVAHDCSVGDGTVVANLVQLGGEVTVGDRAVLGGGALVHQRCRIGTLAIVGGGTVVRQDVPPYASYAQLPTQVTVWINKIGLERAGMLGEVEAITAAYRAVYREGLSLGEATGKIREMAEDHACLGPLADFLGGIGASGLVRPRRAALRS